MNSKIYIYKILFIALFILIVFDIVGWIKNLQSFIFTFFSISLIIHGMFTINFFLHINRGFFMVYFWFKKCINYLISFFCQKKKVKQNRKIANKTNAVKKNNMKIKKKKQKN